jgi:hypothetical protein
VKYICKENCKKKLRKYYKVERHPMLNGPTELGGKYRILGLTAWLKWSSTCLKSIAPEFKLQYH